MSAAELAEPFLVTVSRFSDWEAASFEIRSPAWQYAECPSARGLWGMQGVRFFKSTDTMPLLNLGAPCGFWSLGKPWLQKMCSSQGIDLPKGMTNG